MSDSISLGTFDDGINPSVTERSDAAANRLLLMTTAERLFAEHGVAHVNMADIAKAAGVGKGTLYRRFTSKGELCLALLDSQMVQFQETMLARMRQMSEQGVTKLEQLGHFLDALVHFTDQHIPLLCEAQQGGLLGSGHTGMPHFWQHMTVSGLLKAAAESGELPEDLDILYLSDALLANFSADMFRFQRQVRGFSLERISTGLQALVSGLKHCNQD